MLNSREFEDWCHRLNLSDEVCSLIEQIRCSEPVRRVRSNGINVCGRYSSQKNGRVSQFESHKVELPALEEYEEDSDVLEYYDQPYRLTLKVKTKSGKTITVSHVPDFFVIRRDSAGFEEWKTFVRLEKLATKQPTRYIFSEDKGWYSPPAEEVVQQLGLYYRIRSEREIHWVKYRNRQFLKAYSAKTYQVNCEVAERILSEVAMNPGITYSELLQISQATSDEINSLIANQEICLDLSAAPLAEPSRVHLFISQGAADAYALWIEESKRTQENSHEVTIARQHNYGTVSLHPEAMERYLKASPEDLAEANRRYQIIEKSSEKENSTVSERTVRYWKAKFRAAQIFLILL